MQTRIGGFAEQLGIVFDMRAQKKRPSTLDSHRLIHWAGASGVEDAVVEALFRAYFEQGRDIGDRDVLAAIADAAGLDADQTRARLELDDDVALIQSEVRAAFESGVTGVPTFSFEGFRIPGAQEPAVYESVIRRVIARRG
jgi:predicted DsbA family dithiol-disulfide isomerase